VVVEEGGEQRPLCGGELDRALLTPIRNWECDCD
jgi:hypothetical protein